MLCRILGFNFLVYRELQLIIDQPWPPDFSLEYHSGDQFANLNRI